MAGTDNSPSAGTGFKPCAACRHQRRKCAPDCLLAPYFPSALEQDFIHAHKLFGVSNMQKILEGIVPEERPIAATTMRYEANVRAEERVDGCYGIIRRMEMLMEYYKAELHVVQNQLKHQRALQDQKKQRCRNSTTPIPNENDFLIPLNEQNHVFGEQDCVSLKVQRQSYPSESSSLRRKQPPSPDIPEGAQDPLASGSSDQAISEDRSNSGKQVPDGVASLASLLHLVSLP